jgi:phosphoribosyl 1,2-cyclic phosphodiesterase
MLADSDYPFPLKQRIAGRYGHLCNDGAATLLGAIDTSRLRHVIAAHLSRQNNTPEKARAALAAALDCAPEWIGVADQANGFDWRSL